MSSKIIELTISEEHIGLRLDKFLSLQSEIRTRSKAEHLISSGFVLINGRSTKPSYSLKASDLVRISIPEEKKRTLEASNIPLDIHYEDEDIIVVNKPAGLVVHPSAGHESDTLVNALLNHTTELSMKFNEERPGIVHRIDKETSGLLVVAKNDIAHEFLVKEFQERKVHRIYKAVCYGTPLASAGRIESYIGRHPIDRKRFASVANGKWAATNYRVLKSLHQMSYLELKLETGRTHQIRVHLSENGHPLVGDLLYGSTRRIKSIQSTPIQNQIRALNRFLLHAEQLGFLHPRSLQMLHFQVDWPQRDHDILQQWGFT